MSVYVSTTYLGDGSPLQLAIDNLQGNGIFKIELGSNHSATNIKSLDLSKKSRYIAHNYFPAVDPTFVLNIASQDNRVRERSVKFIKDTIKLCHRLKIKFYTIHPGFLGKASLSKSRKVRNFDFQFTKSKSARDKVVQETTRVVKNLYKFANLYNVQLLIENEGSKTSSQFVIFGNPKELDFLKEEVGRSLKFNFNLAHATLAGIDLKNKKTFTHFWKDSPFFEVSELKGKYDSHLPIAGRGTISSLLQKHAKDFAKKNIILEYRNINIKEVKLSYEYVSKLLKSGTPPVK